MAPGEFFHATTTGDYIAGTIRAVDHEHVLVEQEDGTLTWVASQPLGATRRSDDA